MTPTAVSEVVEQLMRVITMLVFADMFLPYGLAYAAGGASMGAGVDYEFNKLGSWDNEARDWFVAERARELLWEGHRRTDLIRYGLFTSVYFTNSEVTKVS